MPVLNGQAWGRITKRLSETTSSECRVRYRLMGRLITYHAVHIDDLGREHNLYMSWNWESHLELYQYFIDGECMGEQYDDLCGHVFYISDTSCVSLSKDETLEEGRARFVREHGLPVITVVRGLF